MMKKLYKINELPTDMQKDIYNKYLEDSNVTEEETSLEDFIDYSVTYLGEAYTKDGRFIDEL